MKRILDPVVQSAADLTQVSKRMLEDGVQFFRGALGEIPLLSSVIIDQANASQEEDQTHYYLVPNHLETSGYTLFTQRVLPEGTAPENDLPKIRTFHLPNKSTEDILMAQFTDRLKNRYYEASDRDSSLADRLDLLADEIDNQSNKVTGGLVIIGGVIAIANPLLGIGIAAKALLPSIGAKVSKHGINHVTDWLRQSKSKSSAKTASKKANRELRKFKPQVVIDSTLALLERALATSDPDFDPNLEFATMLNSPSETTSIILTSKAIHAVYEEILVQPKSHSTAHLHKADIAWLQSIEELSRHKTNQG